MRVLAVDDHDLVLRGLNQALSLEGWMLSEARTYHEALCHLQKRAFDVVLVDLSLIRSLGEPEEISVGFELLDYIKQNIPDLPAIVVTGIKWSEAPRYLFFAERAGALGYLCKNETLQLIQGIKALYMKESPALFSAEQCRCIMTFTRKRPALTGREREVMRCLAQGLSQQKIADQLSISTTTLKTHLRHIYAKLQVSATYDALKQGQQWGFLEEGWLRDQ